MYLEFHGTYGKILKSQDIATNVSCALTEILCFTMG
jgi:hypothetical protein